MTSKHDRSPANTASPEGVTSNEAEPTHVIFIMGAGRSGSTFLGLSMARALGAVYAGELGAWAERDGVPNFGGAERERFWIAVKRRMIAAGVSVDDNAWWRFEHSTRFLRPRRRNDATAHRDYLRCNRALFSAVAIEAANPWIIDSSHRPARATELRGAPGLEVDVVYLMRDPTKVVRSFRKRDVDQPRKGLLAANAYLWLTSLVAVITYMRWPHTRRHYLDYDDFVHDPTGELARLAREIGLPSPGRFDLSDLAGPIAFQGNRLLNSTVSLTSPAERGGAPGPSDLLTYLLQFPWVLVRLVLRHRWHRS